MKKFIIALIFQVLNNHTWLVAFYIGQCRYITFSSSQKIVLKIFVKNNTAECQQYYPSVCM